jgi:hypothetical protein
MRKRLMYGHKGKRRTRKGDMYDTQMTAKKMRKQGSKNSE